MAISIIVRKGTRAQFDSPGGAALVEGELGYVTDEKLFICADNSADNTAQIPANGCLVQATDAKPTQDAADYKGMFAYDQTALDLWVSDGSDWYKCGVNDLADMAGDLDDIADGTNYVKVNNADVTGGQVIQVRAVSGAENITGDALKTHMDNVTTNPHGVDLDNVADADGSLASGKLLTILTGADLRITDAPAVATDAVNKTYVDGLVSGISWKAPATVKNLLGEFTEAEINALSPNLGDGVISEEACTPSATGSDTLAIGDIAEYQGAVLGWQITVANSGNRPPNGTRCILDTDGTLVAPFVNATDDGRVVVAVADGGADFDGSVSDWDDTGDAVDKNAILIQNDTHDSVFENLGYTFEGTVPSGTWVQFTGAGSITAGDGLYKSGNTLSIVELADSAIDVQATGVKVAVDDSTIEITAGTPGSINVKALGITAAQIAASTITAAKMAGDLDGNGLTQAAGAAIAVDPDSETGGDTQPVSVGANGVGLDVSAIAGTGIEADGSANLRLAAQGNGIDGGAGATLSVKPDVTTGAGYLRANVAANGVSAKYNTDEFGETVAGTLNLKAVSGGGF